MTMRQLILSLIGAVLLLSADALYADSPRKSASRGVEHFKREEFDKALAEFMAALDKDPSRPEIRYDLGTALYKLQQFPQAAEALSKAASSSDPKLAGNAWFNIGNALLGEQKFDEAVAAYKQALKLNHQDEDAKHNLEMALQMKQMMQQQMQARSDSTGQKKDQQQNQQKSQLQQDKQSQEEEQQEPQQAMNGADSTGQNEDEPQPEQMAERGPMSREEARKLLQALENEEQEAQKEKLKRQSGEPARPEKDW
ncbi:MAG: tetratricopeptide repeat protein [Calditrichaeota bacterium]|nr:tetratricopeptide repeat protein [Calditrichota bacterium]